MLEKREALLHKKMAIELEKVGLSLHSRASDCSLHPLAVID
jgi:hypothetical protein